MAAREHTYQIQVEWSGNLVGMGTSAYSIDPSFRVDAARDKPEDLLIGALAGRQATDR